MAEVNYLPALLAGIISFLSPCVLPLVPPYLSYLAGTTFEHVMAREPNAQVARREIVASLLFVALGAGASAIGGLLRAYSNFLSIIAGIAIITMGFHFLGVFRIPLMARTARLKMDKPVGLWGAYVMGLAFAFGWTPCIGPVLAAILALAASEATITRGASLLAVYSLGLGIPFVLAAFALKPFVATLARVRHRLGLVEKAMGAMLVLTGIAFLTGWVTRASYWLLETFPMLANFG